ncbi:putative lipoprotein [Streptomyces viridochromogenes Tue57]|uniref:Putative lipoprotein n=1 Tax=Streptomyces viridochromogenes Tue57 TaxID=1160705 RepID=L8PQC1_STRVR|nr:putative lipoprotein [Streptomyces viridochromogenes Tue57]
MANSTEYVTDVQPGQTTTGDSPTTLDDTNVKINITDFNRTKAY